MYNDKGLFREVFNFLVKWKEKEITSETLQEMSKIMENKDYDKLYAQRLLFATADYIAAYKKS